MKTKWIYFGADHSFYLLLGPAPIETSNPKNPWCYVLIYDNAYQSFSLTIIKHQIFTEYYETESPISSKSIIQAVFETDASGWITK